MTDTGGVVRRLRRTVALPVLLAALVLAPVPPAGAIFHGTLASPGEYRGAAFVLVTDSGGQVVSTCGGTLVAPSKVLTAAHCVGAGDMYVALDLTDLQQIQNGSAELHAVVDVVQHPQWDGESIEYDVAVLTLAQPSAVPPVRVARLDETALWDSGSTGTIVGWGATENASSSDQLREAEVAVDDSGCFSGATIYCAGDGDPAACQGDSGGPMLATAGGEPVVVGVIVAGPQGCGGGVNYYARVGGEPLQGWLREQIATPSDTTAPRVTAATPTGSRVSRRTDLAVTFSEQVDAATVSRSTFRLLRLTAAGPRRVTDVRVRPTADGLGARLDPFGPSRTRLAGATRYRAVVTTGVRDLAGNQLDQDAATGGLQPKAWTFRTAR